MYLSHINTELCKMLIHTNIELSYKMLIYINIELSLKMPIHINIELPCQISTHSNTKLSYEMPNHINIEYNESNKMSIQNYLSYTMSFQMHFSTKQHIKG